MPTFTYRIQSPIVWSSVVEDADRDEVRSAGENLVAQGNHTVSGPADIDEYTREWVLTFPDMAAWNTYKASIITSNNGDTLKPGYSVIVVSTPDD